MKVNNLPCQEKDVELERNAAIKASCGNNFLTTIIIIKEKQKQNKKNNTSSISIHISKFHSTVANATDTQEIRFCSQYKKIKRYMFPNHY